MRKQRSNWQQAREVAYLLRTNLPAADLEQLWKSYIQLTEAEVASCALDAGQYRFSFEEAQMMQAQKPT